MRVGKLLAAVLVTLCIGVQVLEATGRWDRTIQDVGDEAVIVAVALCVGAALVTAGRILSQLRVARIRTQLSIAHTTVRTFPTASALTPLSSASPPLPLRI